MQLRTRLDETEKERDTMKEECWGLTQESKELKTNTRQLTHELNTSIEKNTRISDENERLQQSMSTLDSKNDELTAAVKTAGETQVEVNRKLKAAVDALESQKRRTAEVTDDKINRVDKKLIQANCKIDELQRLLEDKEEAMRRTAVSHTETVNKLSGQVDEQSANHKMEIDLLTSNLQRPCSREC